MFSGKNLINILIWHSDLANKTLSEIRYTLPQPVQQVASDTEAQLGKLNVNGPPVQAAGRL